MGAVVHCCTCNCICAVSNCNSSRFATASHVYARTAATAAAAGNADAQAGSYSLTQQAANATHFERWDCYSVDTSSGNTTLLTTTNATSPNITLTFFNVVTCVAVYSASPPIKAAPQLILFSDYGAAGMNYSGPAASLFANTTGDACAKAPAPRWGVDGNFTAPGVALCGNNGTNNATKATVLVSRVCRMYSLVILSSLLQSSKGSCLPCSPSGTIIPMSCTLAQLRTAASNADSVSQQC